MNGSSTTIKTPATNQGDVLIDPVEGTVTVESAGDKVTIEMSPYDLTKGRIIWRDK